ANGVERTAMAQAILPSELPPGADYACNFLVFAHSQVLGLTVENVAFVRVKHAWGPFFRCRSGRAAVAPKAMESLPSMVSNSPNCDSTNSMPSLHLKKCPSRMPSARHSGVLRWAR